MYLGLLNEAQKELYAELAINLASADGTFSEEERLVADAYCQEMGISYNYNTEIPKTAEIIEKLNEISDIKVKRIVVFEAIGLAMADNNFHANERSIIKLMADKFTIDEIYIDQCIELIDEYTRFQTKVNNLVVG